jgi:LAS superfamily LD-carboxypeptidase LdcB
MRRDDVLKVYLSIMRVVEPHQFRNIRPQRKSRSWRRVLSLLVSVLLMVVLLAVPTYWYALRNTAPESGDTDLVQPLEPEQDDEIRTGRFRQFTGEEFKSFYLTVAHPNTTTLNEHPVITGDPAADERIRQLAEERGYRLSAIPMSSIVRLDEPRLDSDDLLQPLAAESWRSLKKAAHDDGYPISLLSGYRSLEYQRELFMQRLRENGGSVTRIARGFGDAAVRKTLELTAPPGYSRHHTGYTIDLWCEDGSSTFLSSRCYEWISAENYQKAKEHGWIPSYPDGTSRQGPEPEPWEYVWVGRSSLLE